LSARQVVPTLHLELRLWAQGFHVVAGLDEAGRGPWAGPLVAAAVALPADDPDLLAHLEGVRDSKQLTPPQRERLLPRILGCALASAVGVVEALDIDCLGIVAATRLAMSRALAGLHPPPDALLIDHLRLPDAQLPQESLPHGDALVLSIAAASILAKVHRDRLMEEAGRRFPGYGFARHKGYGTPQHRDALRELGPCSLHRLSFAPLRAMTRAQDASTGGLPPSPAPY